MNKEKLDCHTIGDGLSFIERKMKEWKTSKQAHNQNLLVSEEILTRIMETAAPDAIRIKTERSFGECSIRFIFHCDSPVEIIDDEDTTDISGRILSHYAERIRTKYKQGTMTVTLLVEQSYTRFARLSILAVLLAVITSYFVMHFAPQNQFAFLENRLLWLIESIFTKAICLIATPVTFFCITSNVATFSSLTDRYPQIHKLAFRYVFTSIAAVVIGYVVFLAIRPILSGIVFPEYQLKDAVIVNVSDIWLAIAGMVPESILEPFITSATLPIFFVAAITGVAVAAVDQQSGHMKDSVETIKSLFCKMLSVIFWFSPLIIFLCVFELIIYHGFIVLLYQALFIAAVILCSFITIASYSIPLSVNRINPFRLMRVMRKSFWNTFMIGSLDAAIPDTIEECAEKLHFPKRPLEVSIPLGTTLNMDGNCGTLMLLMMIMAEVAGIKLSMQTILIVGLFILAISFGAPNQPGSITVGAMILLPQIGVTTEMVTTALLIEIASNRFLALSNMVGSVVCTEIVGENERRMVQKQREKKEQISEEKP